MPGGTGPFGCLPGGLSLSIQSQQNDGRGSAAGGRGSEVAAIRLGRLGCSIWSSSSNSWGAHWVRCHRPADLTAVVTLAEDHLAANPGPSREEPQRSDRVLLPRLPVAVTQRRDGGPVGTEQAAGWSPRNLFRPLLPAGATGSRKDAGAGMLEVWVTGVPVPRVSAHGGGASVLCCRCPSTRPRSGRDIQHTRKVSRGYTPRFGGHGLHADPGPSKFGSPGGIVRS